MFLPGQETEDGKWILKNNFKKPPRDIIIFYQPWTFPENYLDIFFKNFANKKWKKEKKQTHYNQNKVFHWKLKTLMMNECQTLSQTKKLLWVQYRSFHVPSCSISTQFLCSLPSGCPGNQLLKVTGRLEFSHLNWPSSSWSLSPIHTAHW